MAESLVQAPAAVEDEGRDEGPGIVSPAREDLGEGGLRPADGGIPVDPDAMIGRIHPGHDRGMRGQGQRRGGSALFEQDAAAGQGVQDGRPHAWIAVAGQVVGACRVHGDDDDVGLVHALLFPPARDARPSWLPRAEDEKKEDRGGDREGGEDAEKDVLFHDHLKK